MKFRFHRASLDEAMKTVIEVKCLEDIRQIFIKNEGLYENFQLACKYYCFDYRIGWDTWVISAYPGNVPKELRVSFPIGFLNGELK